MTNEHTAIEITDKAKNNVFEDCNVYGKVKMAGSGNKMIRTNIYQFTKEHPFIFWITLIASLATIIGFVMQILK